MTKSFGKAAICTGVVVLLFLHRCIACDGENDPVTPANGDRSSDDSRLVSRDDLVEASHKAYQDCESMYPYGFVRISDLHEWSLRWANDIIAAHPDNSQRLSAYKQHLTRMQQIGGMMRKRDSKVAVYNSQLAYYVLEAKKLLSDATPSNGAGIADKAQSVTLEDLAKASQKAYEDCEMAYFNGLSRANDLHGWSLKWVDDVIAAHPGRSQRITAYEEHLARMRRIQRLVKDRDIKVSFDDSQLAYDVLEARKLLSDAKLAPQDYKIKSR